MMIPAVVVKESRIAYQIGLVEWGDSFTSANISTTNLTNGIASDSGRAMQALCHSRIG
jgi:hypothetical protein